MSFLSAVSLLLATSNLQNGLSTPLSPALARYAQDRTLTLTQFSMIVGEAVVVSPQGEALTAGEVAFGSDGNPRIGLKAFLNGETPITVKVEAFDPVTDLALIRVPVSPDAPYKYAELASKLTSSIVLAVLPSGARRAQITQAGIPGVMGQNKRYVPLNEIRLEGNGARVAGSPLFLPDGKLAGLLVASLNINVNQDRANFSATKEPAAAILGGAPSGVAGLTKSILGPQPSETSYTLDIPVLDRVLAGFQSESRQVRHPWIGLFFKTANSGAEVTEVVAGSPAAEGRLQAGDIITQAGSKPITSHLDLAAYLFNLKVGSSVDFTITRADSTRKLQVRVAVEPVASPKALKRGVI